MTVVAVLGGGDWADASADFLVLPEGMDIKTEKKLYDDWYHHTYCKKRGTPYLTFAQWLTDKGAREPTEDELIIFEEF